MRRRSPSAEEDRAAFRAAVADAQPLTWDRVEHEPPLPPAIPRHSRLDEAAVLREAIDGSDLLDLQLEGGDQAAWARPGLQRSVLRDLRRGRWVVQAKLDLHGMNRDEARRAVTEFLHDCHRRGLRCVRVVHGKGIGSPGREPILKKLALGWLSQRREVLAFCQARTIEGGAGAAVVLLAAPTRPGGS
ncbi:MAG: Smr/MutS family protein [Rhodocyclales bacterium]|nr:Smr/MutS family protein [Rhodocyclales bacterium]